MDCLVLEDMSNGHILLPFYLNRRQSNGYERWAAYEFDSKENIDLPCRNGTPALIDRDSDGKWHREWST